MDYEAIFEGPYAWFVNPTVERVLEAIACNETGTPWPDWPEPERTAVAILLGDDERLAADHFHNLLGPVRCVGRPLGIHFGTVLEAEPFFAAIRAAVDAKRFAREWDRLSW